VLKPKKDRSEDLISLTKHSNQTMQRLGFISSREPILATDIKDLAAEYGEIHDLEFNEVIPSFTIIK